MNRPKLRFIHMEKPFQEIALRTYIRDMEVYCDYLEELKNERS